MKRVSPATVCDARDWEPGDTAAVRDHDGHLQRYEEEWVASATPAAVNMPAPVHNYLSHFAAHPPASGTALVRSLPLGPIPPTPSHPTASTDKNDWTERLLVSVTQCLGHPVGYLPEHGGALVQNIVPTRESATRQISTSSTVGLAFHTEAAFHPHRPSYVVLLCLRGDVNAATLTASIRDIVASLSTKTLAILRSPRFATAVDESYLRRPSRALGEPLPVLTGPVGSECICFDGDLMKGLDTAATHALAELNAAIAFHTQSVILHAGDALIVDNTVAIHGRSPFTPRYDGTDRWLQRSFAVSDLQASNSSRQGRVITTRFDGPDT